MLCQGAMSELQPKFVLVGSAKEGTRIGLANEMDVLVKFGGLKTGQEAPFRVENAFYLAKAESESTMAVESYFDGSRFNFHKFKKNMLDIVRNAVCVMYDQKKNPPYLKFIKTNDDWMNENCLDCMELKENNNGALFEHCKKCPVNVCQTKPGVALQFQWMWQGQSIYTSIDLIPVFPIIPIGVVQLAKLVNTSMICPGHPQGWLEYLSSYFKHYKEIQGDGEEIKDIVLKTMSNQPGDNYYVRPSLPCNDETFVNEITKQMYTYMKYLKHVLNLNVSSYFIKSQLNKEHSQSIMESCINAETSMGGLEINKSRWDVALVALISQPDFMSTFGGKIDLKKSSKEGHICLSEESGNKNPEAEITETTPALIASQA